MVSDMRVDNFLTCENVLIFTTLHDKLKQQVDSLALITNAIAT